MNGPEEMHPRIYERRKEVYRGRMESLSDEEAMEDGFSIVRHYEGKLPRPENYRKKTNERLRINLRNLDQFLELCDGQRDKGGIPITKLSAMYQRHRGYIIKELARRMVKRA
jgi:hypothetical protein